METSSLFFPPRRRGLLVHLLVASLMLVVGGYCFWRALQGESGARYLILLTISIGFLAPSPLVFYRAHALSQASYRLNRDGLRLRWGLRAEDLPLQEVEWIRPAAEMGFRLPLPVGWAPGAILGVRRIEGLGEVEFMASEQRSLLLVATPRRVYAISPADVKAFERSFYRTIELSSLTPLAPFSARPAAYARHVWRDNAARILTLTGLGLVMLLFLVSAFLMATRTSISLGFDANLQPFDPGPPERLLLLPFLGGATYVVNLLAGLFFYRRYDLRPVSYLLWAGCVLTPLLLLIALAFI